MAINFTSEIKREIFSLIPTSGCCIKAALSALLATSGSCAPDHLQFISENEEVARLFFQLAENAFTIRPEVFAFFDPKRKKDKVELVYRGAKSEEIFRELGFSDHDICLITQKDCCALTYLKCAFLGSGSSTLPNGEARTGYHLEFSFNSLDFCEQFGDLLIRFQLFPRMIQRGERYILYVKSEDALSDFFYVIGAKSALEKIERVTTERARNNLENRRSNCYARNADRTAKASAEVIFAINQLKEKGNYRLLSDELQTTANGRISYPMLSLGELATRLNITKSCLNHRLRKILEIYHNTEENHD